MHSAVLTHENSAKENCDKEPVGLLARLGAAFLFAGLIVAVFMPGPGR